MNLAFLSIQHCPRGVDPVKYENPERARIFRDSLPVELANNHPWDHIKRVEYARQETLDGRDS